MMTAEFMLSKRPVLRFTAALFFLLKLFSSHIYCILQCLLFSNKSLNHSFKIKLGDVEVTNNNTAKYLGTTLDDKLTWQYHIQIVPKKLSVARRRRLAGHLFQDR